MRTLSSLRRLLQAVVLCSLSLAAPAAARASGGGGLFFDGFASFGRIDDYSLHIPALITEPDPLKEKSLRIDGGGNFFGGGFHGVFYGKEARGGLGLGIFDAEGLELHHDALPTGLSASIGSAWGMYVDAFIGRELLKGPVSPYVDVRATFDLVEAEVQLHHPSYGLLGETPFNAYSFGVGPRLGLSIQVNDPWAIDISGYYGLFGAEQTTIVASIGFRDRDR